MSEAMLKTERQWQRQTTLAALCVVSMLKGADLQLLPASFRAMEVDLKLRPSALGGLALCQGVACAVAGPFWGNLVDSGVPRKLLLTLGAAIWGTCTMMLAFVSKFSSMALLRACNGAALAMLLPVLQSFVLDITRKSERGYIFGWIFFFSNLGQVIACLFVTPISNQEIYGTDGWRVALAVVGGLSWSVVLLVPLLVSEEPRPWRPDRLGPSKELKKLVNFLHIPTFCVIILQGIFGTIPGAAQSFTTMYFQYSGVPDAMCAFMNSLRIIGDACGGILGGYIGDVLSTRSPSYGRPLTAQISVLASLPLVYGIFMAHGPSTPQSLMGASAGFLFLQGLVGSWVAPGCLCPIMCDIVPKRSLASAYAWELALVFCSGNALGPTLVGMLSQGYFGYHMSDEKVGHMDPTSRQRNAEALGKAVFYSSAVPYCICALLFSFLYLTYSRDVRVAADSDLSDAEVARAERMPVKGEPVPFKLGADA